MTVTSSKLSVNSFNKVIDGNVVCTWQHAIDARRRIPDHTRGSTKRTHNYDWTTMRTTGHVTRVTCHVRPTSGWCCKWDSWESFDLSDTGRPTDSQTVTRQLLRPWLRPPTPPPPMGGCAGEMIGRMPAADDRSNPSSPTRPEYGIL